MSKLLQVLSFDEASRTSHARSQRSARDSRARGRSAREDDFPYEYSERTARMDERPARMASGGSYRSRGYDSPLSWDSLSLNSASAYRTGVLRTASSESRRRSAPAYDSSDFAFEREARGERYEHNEWIEHGARYEHGERESRRATERRYAEPRMSSRESRMGEREYRSSEREVWSSKRETRRSVRESRGGEHEARRNERDSRSTFSLIDRIKQKRHDYRKAKAGRKFAAQFEDAPSDASQNAPRAALYTGSLGSKQRQAMDMQHSSSRTSSRARRSGGEERKASLLERMRSPQMLAVGIVTICLVAVCAFIYPTARGYYHSVRQNAQLEAEYAAIQERNTALQQEVDSLQSDQGIHDRAHELYGWVGAGENSVLVQGIERSTEGKTSGYQASIAPDSIPAPDTWYSPVLDWFFGYDNSPSN